MDGKLPAGSDETEPYPEAPKSASAAMVGRPEVLDRVPWADPDVWAQADANFPVRVPRGWLEASDPLDPSVDQQPPAFEEGLRAAGLGSVDEPPRNGIGSVASASRHREQIIEELAQCR